MGSSPQAASSKDDRSVAEARELIERAYTAWQQFQYFPQEQVDRIVEAVAGAAAHNAERLAKLAVEETGYGIVADKTQKNLFAAERVAAAMRGMRTAGIVRERPGEGIVEVAVPVGVVAAVLPSTNPTSTAIYKILIALKGRNAIVLSPHPTALRCTCEATSLMRDAAARAGAPADVICCFTTPTLAGTQELMKHRRTAVILATGGMAMVRAAYSSGKPAFGVGPGNVPAFIDRSADIAKAVKDVVFGKTFDNGTICSSEQAIVAEEAIRPQVESELKRNGAYFLSASEIATLGKLMVDLEKHTINPKFVGKSAVKVAEGAGLKVPAQTRVLVACLDGVGREWPLSAEKLSPVLALYFAKERAAAMETCLKLLRFGGLGHTCSIHAKDDAVIREYGLKMPAGRVVVNSPAPQGSIGATTNLFPAMTLGCGAVGGNITSDNISPLHLVNLRRIAYAARPVEESSAAGLRPAAVEHVCEVACACPHAVTSGCASKPEEAPEAQGPEPVAGAPDRVAIARAIERFLAQKQGSARAQPEGNEVGTKGRAGELPAPHAAPSKPAAPVPRPQPRPAEFVSEAEVRAAIRHREKIVIGRKTIVTPAARDLAAEYDVFLKAE
jgi:acetaldehyde dehydrogenase (acetylating)